MPSVSVKDLTTDLLIRYGFQILGALVILGVGLLLARWVGNLMGQWLERRNLEPPVRILMVRAVRLVVLMFTLVVALDKLGFQVAPLVAGIGVGIALQGVLSNMVAGLSIILTKPFRVGEWISIVGVYGQVSAIELFSTTLAHPDPAWSFPTARSSARSCTTTARSDSSI
jgi:small conductance mechanosensitive channel